MAKYIEITEECQGQSLVKHTSGSVRGKGVREGGRQVAQNCKRRRKGYLTVFNKVEKSRKNNEQWISVEWMKGLRKIKINMTEHIKRSFGFNMCLVDKDWQHREILRGAENKVLESENVCWTCGSFVL